MISGRTFFEIRPLRGFTALTREHQGNTGLVRGFHCQMRPLGCGETAEKQCVVAFFGLVRPLVDMQRIVYATSPIQIGRQFALPITDGDQRYFLAQFAVVVIAVALVDRPVHGHHCW